MAANTMRKNFLFIPLCLVVVLALTALITGFVLPARRLSLGDELLNNGNPASALAVYNELAASPMSRLPFGPCREAVARLPQAELALGEVLLAEAEYNQAAEAFQRAGSVEAAAYCLGRVAMDAGDYEAAVARFAEAADYADAHALLSQSNEALITALLETAPAQAVVAERITSYDARTVAFGRYEQDGDAQNGPEPIVWRVLDERGEAVLLISDLILDSRPFHNGFMVVTWESCSLRMWLNGAFLQAAFNQKEREALRAAWDETAPSAFGIPDPTADDLVSLLSRDVLSAYFPDGRAALATPYAMSAGAVNKGWWLRTDGYESDDAAYCGDWTGAPRNAPVHEKGIGVRPVIWIDASALGHS